MRQDGEYFKRELESVREDLLTEYGNVNVLLGVLIVE